MTLPKTTGEDMRGPHVSIVIIMTPTLKKKEGRSSNRQKEKTQKNI